MEIQTSNNYDVECEECGKILVADENRGTISVRPCKYCVDSQLDAQFKEGYAEGYETAKEEFEKPEEAK